MPIKEHAWKAAWTVVDQAVVSVGNFVVNIVLARYLAPHDYGIFALLFGIFMCLQIINQALVFYPLSIKLPLASREQREALISDNFWLIVLSSVPIGLALAIGLAASGLAGLALPTVAAFVMWQFQEAMRRGLLSEFRHQTAVIGDTLSYFGQAGVVLLLAHYGNLTLPNVMWSMAAIMAAGTIIQALQLGFRVKRPIEPRATVSEYVGLGRWLLGSHIMTVLRHQIPLWALAAIAGPASTAAYQAALNLVNLTNPMVFGLANIIPQTVAKAMPQGAAHAWKTARIYAVFGAVPTFGYYTLALLFPTLCLTILYGAASPYVDQATPVRLLMLAWMASFVADMICAYIVGTASPRLALIVNGAGTLATALLAVPCALLYGVTGMCVAVVAANVARMVMAKIYLDRIVSGDTQVPLHAAQPAE